MNYLNTKILIEVLLFVSTAMVVYVYIGYPVFLGFISIFIRKSINVKAVILPEVSLIISAYNEENSLEGKINNSLMLEYPKDKLEIIVVSDASTDQTDFIVQKYKKYGVILKRMEERLGKTVGLNATVPLAKGEFIVFSDANTLYSKDAINILIKNFSDPQVGCVTGDSHYKDFEKSHIGQNENTYWSYERYLKTKESQLGSIVGADGAFFAVRKSLFMKLKEEDINDFVTPLQIVGQGYRCVFEQNATCYEEPAGQLDKEFRRKVRIANRSWNGLLGMKHLLNPFRYGWFSIKLISHKLLRWFTPVFLIVLFASSLLLITKSRLYLYFTSLQLFFYTLSIIGLMSIRVRESSRLISFSVYFLVANIALLLGLIKALRGEKIKIWEPERVDQTSTIVDVNGYYKEE